MIRKTFKNCVSLLVSKSQSQKLINAFLPETKESALYLTVFEYVFVVPLLLRSLWLWFGLVSLFNGISTFVRLFNAKAILPEE